MVAKAKGSATILAIDGGDSKTDIVLVESSRRVAPRAIICRIDAPPVVGAALIGLVETGASRALGDSVRLAVNRARLKGP